jgi:hypothetical protein
VPLILGRSPRAVVTKPSPDLPIKMLSMQGLGDNLHQRAIVRQLMAQQVVYLDSSWPSVYHDLVGPRLQLVRPAAVALRTQAKNAVREAARYHTTKAPRQVRLVRIWYQGADVAAARSVLGAMARAAGVRDDGLDFRMPVPRAWHQALDTVFPTTSKPIMLYRPLVERTEWGGCASRNPDVAAYDALFQSIASRYHVVSVADLVPGKEWLAYAPVPADTVFHHGELTFEMLAALAQRASLTFCSPGFAAPLSQAVGTPTVVVFGGYENSSSFSIGARYTPYLGIDPIIPCSCFSHTHTHRKSIDLPPALQRLQDFVSHARSAPYVDPATSRLELALARHRLAHPIETIHEPGGVGDAGGAGAQRQRQGGA